jgi:hypothetical protein
MNPNPIKSLLITVHLFWSCFSYSQAMRPLEQLINTQEPGWPLVQEWMKKATNKIEVLSRDSTQANQALYQTQVTTRSPMGAIIYMTGGILIDNGWVRILGSGNPRLPRTLPDWNKGKTFNNFGEHPSFLLIADDVLGGFYAINGGALGKDMGKVYYLAPDTMEWEAMDKTYTEFLLFCFSGDLSKYYEDYRWKGWQKEVAEVKGDQAFNFFPPLFTKEGKDLTKSSRKAIPVEEQYSLTLEMQKQLQGKK